MSTDRSESPAVEKSGRPQVSSPTADHNPDLRGFLTLVREDWQTNGCDWHHPGTQALFAYRLGRYRRGVKSRPVRKALSLAYKFLQRRSTRSGIELRDSAVLGRRIYIPHAGAIVFHRDGVVGDDCLVRQGVTMGRARLVDSAQDHPIIGRGVQIGVGAVLMGAIVIGDGAKIGPNSVVTTDVPEGATVFGPTARILNF